MMYDLRFTTQLFIFFILFGVIFLSSCNTKPTSKKEIISEWNSGTITIATDENLKNIAEQLSQIYEHENPAAHIIFNYQPQDKIINDFVNGKITSMLISRNLTKNEKEISTNNQHTKTLENVFGFNAVATISNQNFNDSILDINKLTNYLQANSTVKLVFDNKQSGIARYIMKLANIEPALFKNALVVNNSNEVVEYVKRNQSSIGFIPFNLISNRDEEETNKLTQTIKILDIKQNDTIYEVSQASIYSFSYPLQQSINIVLGRNPELVGTGFTNFLTKERSAKILLRAGLVPAFMPKRNFEIRNEVEIK
ncbi:MAG TPA: substrate-binding domain-containing protein [Chitinophagales bacterium]|nr:substrate-binding domain-containing protein [Chitinophagales bacterium]